MQISAINSYTPSVRRNSLNNNLMTKPAVSFEGKNENNGDNKLITIPKGLLKAMLLSAAMMGPAALNQSCQRDHEYYINLDQNMEITIQGVEVPCPDCPNKVDTVYIEVEKGYHPEVNDTLINIADSLDIPIEGEGNLIGAISGKLDWEYNADWTSTIKRQSSSDDVMAFTDIRIKQNGKETYGRMNYSLTEPIHQQGENGKLVVVTLQEPKYANKKPENEFDWKPSLESYILGAPHNREMPIYTFDDNRELVKQGKAYMDNGDFVLEMDNGQITAISNFKLHLINSNADSTEK